MYVTQQQHASSTLTGSWKQKTFIYVFRYAQATSRRYFKSHIAETW